MHLPYSYAYKHGILLQTRYGETTSQLNIAVVVRRLRLIKIYLITVAENIWEMFYYPNDKFKCAVKFISPTRTTTHDVVVLIADGLPVGGRDVGRVESGDVAERHHGRLGVALTLVRRPVARVRGLRRHRHRQQTHRHQSCRGEMSRLVRESQLVLF